jgi:predicted nuclease of predicted toxin-antitoxin system
MKLLLDMNLTPAWCDSLRLHGHEVIHWSLTGDPRATDREIMEFAASGGYTVITYDLDFGALLAATKAVGPSVVLVRAGDVTAPTVESLILAAIDACAEELQRGAIVTVDEVGHRVRALPLIR